MPSNDLNKVTQQLRQIKTEAQEAQQNLANMRREIEAMVASLAKGGVPTAEGIQRGTNTLLSGAGTTPRAQRVDPRLRTGGGSRVNLDVAARELQQQIDAYAQATMDAAKARFDKLRVVGAGTRPADIEAKFQQVLDGLDQAMLSRLNQLNVIFQGGNFGGALPPGALTPTSLRAIGQGPPQLPYGTQATTTLPLNTPLLPSGPIAGITPPKGAEPHFAIIEGKWRDIENVTGDILIEERKLLEAVTSATIAEAEAENNRRDIAAATEAMRNIPSGATGAGGIDPEAQQRFFDELARQRKIRRQFSNIYGEQGPERFQQVQQQARQYGFRSTDIKTVDTYAGSYTRLGYAIKDADGIMRRMTITVDKAGNTLVSTQKQFRTFFGAIQRNIGEMIKWSAAVLLVWGSIRKLEELVSLAIDNETQLANVAVVLGEAHANLSDVFNSAAEAAYATGESINGVIEGYAAAYRATGNIENSTERARIAQQLLVDSLVLSKLSTLDQAGALDTLVGALRQTGLSLDQGQQLIDKWVKVSRYAQVSVETLAESFAITATSAQNAGVSIEYLNGLIATIAEVTTLSASESGNAIRAFISSFKSDSAIKELGQFGIAVTDLEGETRDFLSIMQEISALFEAGVISESQLNQIGRAIGGRGARREAQVVAVIKNLGRAEELAAIQADANGEAQAALSIQLETVQTSLTRLDNAFLTLARTMGAEGGVLDATGSVVELFTKLLDITTALTKNLGTLTPIMAGLGLALAATSQQSRQFYYAKGVENLATGATNVSPRAGNFLLDQLTRPGIGRGAQFLGGGVAQLGAGLLTAGTAVKAVQREDYASAGGAIGGGIIGALVTGGSPIGIAIGTAAGQAMASAIFNYKPEFENFFKDTVGGGIDNVEPKKISDPIQDAMEEAFKAAGQITGAGGQVIGESAYLGRAGANVSAYIKNQLIGAGKLIGIQGEFTTPEQEALREADLAGRGREVRQALEDAKRYQQAQQGTGAEATFNFEFVNRQQQYLKQYGAELDKLEQAEADLARTRALGGQITERELRTSLEVIPKLQSGISSFAVGFGDAFAELNPQIKNATDTMEAFARILTQSSPEQIEYLSSINSEIARLTNLVQLAKEAGQDFIIFKPDDPSTEASEEIRYNLAESNDEIQRLQQNAAILATNLNQAAQASFIQLPSITNLGIRSEDLEKVFARARELQRDYIQSTYKASLNEGISVEEIESSFDPIMVQAGETGGYTYAEGFMSSFLQQAVSQMQAAGEILAPQPAALPIRQLDISSGQLPALLARYEQLVNSIRAQAQAGGFQVDLTEETFAGLLTDYVAVPITANLSLLNLGMNELIDVNKKQLEGVYNLPTDASFYVPFQGYELGLGGAGGGGGLGGAATALTEAANDLKDASREMDRVNRDRLREIYQRQDEAKLDTPVVKYTGDFTKPDKPFEYYQNFPALYGVTGEQTTVLDKLSDVLDRLLLGSTEQPTTLAPAPFFEQPVPEPRKPEEPGIFERILQLFVNPSLFGLGAKGVGGGAGIGTPGFGFENAVNRFEGAVGNFETLNQVGPQQLNAPILGGGLTDVTSEFGSVVDLLSQKISNLSGFTTNLKISSTSTTQLIVDGRTLAEVVKPYLYSDMIRFEDTATSITRHIVV